MVKAAVPIVLAGLTACVGPIGEIEQPPFGEGFPVSHTTLYERPASLIPNYCATVGGRIIARGRGCVVTDYSLWRDDSGWCVQVVADDATDQERRALARYSNAVCVGWTPLRP